VDNFDVEGGAVPDSTAGYAEIIALAAMLGMAVRVRRIRA